MINLPADRVLIYRDGSGMVVDLDTIRSELERCCTIAGLRDPELAEDVVDVVHRFWQRQHKAQSRPTLSDLEQLVIQILVDSGMRDVARMFQAKREVPPADPGATMVQVDQLQLIELLGRDPFFLDKAVEPIAERLRDALAHLHLQQVTEGFVQQFARHLWLNQRPANTSQPKRQPGSYWLLTRQDVAPLVAEHASDRLQQAGLRVRPIGSLFPQLALQLSLLEVARGLGQPPLTELLVSPAFDQLADDLAELARHLRLQVERALPEAPPERLPVRLRFTGTTTMMGEWLGLDPRRQADLRQEWSAVLRRTFGTHWQVHIDFG